MVSRLQLQHIKIYFNIGKEELELLKNTKKVKEPVLTAEEKASKANKADIKFTGINFLDLSNIFQNRFQHDHGDF